jgi:hypothetical protein
MTLHIISAYAPTLKVQEMVKEEFYQALDRVLSSVPATDGLLLLGDFNARLAWNYGLGVENRNGLMLLQLCMAHNLIITNTIFRQSNNWKGTWMHPTDQRSGTSSTT